MTSAHLLAYFTGLWLIDPTMDPRTLVRTALLVHVCDACMCRLLAQNRGYARDRWTWAGLILGIWALAVLFLLPDRRPTRQ